jgi:tetratricopeptide (TPR) repeat protein
MITRDTWIIAALVTVSVISCKDEPSPEQVRADAALKHANTLLAGGDSRGGRAALLEVRALDEALGRKALVADEVRRLAELSEAAAEYDSAFFWYAQAKDRYRDIGDRAAGRNITLALAAVHRQMGNDHLAYAIYDESLRLARVFNDEEGVYDIGMAMLPCLRTTGRREEEAVLLQDLLKAALAGGNGARQSAVLFESGISDAANHRYDHATENFLRSLMLAEQAKDSLQAVKSALRLAMAFASAGKTRDALASYGDCLKRADRTPGAAQLRLEALVRVGNLYLNARSFADAERFFRAAQSASSFQKNRLLDAYLLLQLGHCTLESSRAEAVKRYREGQQAFRTLGSPAGQAYAALSLGNVFLKNNQPGDALTYFKKAVELSDGMLDERDPDDLFLTCEQAFVGTRPTPWYDETIELLLQLGRYEEAFWYVDRRNNRELYRALSGMLPVAGADSLNALLSPMLRARSVLLGAQRQAIHLASAAGARWDLLPGVIAVRDREAEQMNAEAKLVAASRPSLEPFVRISGTGLPEIQKALPSNTALVMHVLGRRAVYAFVITSTKSSVQIAAMDKDRVFDLAREFTEQIALRCQYADSSQSDQASLEQRIKEINAPLAEAFLRPVEQFIAGVPNLVIVPPRELPWFPIHALSRPAVRGGGYLIERHAVRYLPAARTAFLLRHPEGAVKEAMALGFSGGSDWDVEYELRDIRAFYKDVRLYFDDLASLGTLQHEHADAVHIAARFPFNDEQPATSCVILADGKTSGLSRRVPLGELLTMPAASLVVVSDLDGSRNGIRPAEPYVFLAGGTNSVIFTSHVPSRKAKKAFGEYLYTALLGGASPEAAYQTAMLTMINSKDAAQTYAWPWFVIWE